MDALLTKLLRTQRRGSKPRCHFLTHGSPSQVAYRLSQLIQPWGTVSLNDRWMPQGFQDLEEAQLHTATRILDPVTSDALRAWWLAVAGTNSKTPNWDIASTCTINGRRGLLLIEAKAHDQELINENGGKKLKRVTSKQSKNNHSRQNHNRIRKCIDEASLSLAHQTSFPWALSRDNRYQMSNRFAWAWKLTEAGFPVILIYLGFLNAHEMRDKGMPFDNTDEWEQLVIEQSSSVVPPEVWNRQWEVNGQTFIPLIRGVEQPLDEG